MLPMRSSLIGEDRMINPQNWSTAKKIFVSRLIRLLTFAIYIGSSIYTPGIDGISEHFHASRVAATQGLTLLVLGYGFLYAIPYTLNKAKRVDISGPLLWSPLSELPTIGRSPTYLLTLIVFVFLEFAAIYSKKFGMLLASRSLTGFIGSLSLATGAASIGDIWNP
ncbi:MFS general substrate transporter [Aspergillus heterothallicus]